MAKCATFSVFFLHRFASLCPEMLCEETHYRPASLPRPARSNHVTRIAQPPLRRKSRQRFHRSLKRCGVQYGNAKWAVRCMHGTSDVPSGVDDSQAVHELYDENKTKVLVETAMLASVSGMSSLLLSLLKLDSYLYYLMPFPLVLAALRSGIGAARKTLVATFFLMLVLLGPPRAISYLLLYGITGTLLGVSWKFKSPWWLSVSACTCGYIVGMGCYIFVASFLLKENLFRLVVYNLQALLSQVSYYTGLQGPPSTPVLVIVLMGLLALRGFFYVVILHVIYAILLVNMGYSVGSMPKYVERALWPSGRRPPI